MAACPETKCLPHTRSSYKISFVRSALLIAEIQRDRDRLSRDSITASFPWFVTTEGRRAKNIPLSRPLLFQHPTTIHNKELIRVCLHFCTPIWRRSNGCQDFCHVSENDLSGTQYRQRTGSWSAGIFPVKTFDFAWKKLTNTIVPYSRLTLLPELYSVLLTFHAVGFLCNDRNIRYAWCGPTESDGLHRIYSET